MGKNFLLTLLSLFVFASSAFAYSSPRWFTMPVTVFLPKDAKESVIVMNAFKKWQADSKGTVRFLYRNTKNLEKLSNIKIEFSNSIGEKAPYETYNRYTTFGHNSLYENTGNFYRTKLIIHTLGNDGKKYTDKELYAITMRAIGEVLGLEAIDSEKSIMTKNGGFSNSTISADDIEELKRVYKPSHKKH